MQIPRDIVPDPQQGDPRGPASGPASERGPMPGDWLGDALGQMTGHIRQRLAEVEDRHAKSLADMETRLSRLSADTSRARTALPTDLASAFGRLEDGMSDLVHRIAESKSAPKEPERFVFGPRKEASHTFVFDRDPAPRASTVTSPATRQPGTVPAIMADGDWDPAAAEALMQLYESGTTGVTASVHHRRADAADTNAPHAFTFVPQAVPVAPAPAPAGLGDDRQWVEDRFTAITADIGRALADARPDAAIDKLMARVDSFESGFASTLSEVSSGLSSVAKTSHVRQLESQISDLAKQIVTVRTQLDKLSAIEQQLVELNALAAAAQDQSHDDHTAESDAPAALAAPALDIEALADAVADKAAARVSALLDTPTQAGTDDASGPGANAGTEALLHSFMDERRRSDEATNGMLDIMQEALVRLIDRVEAIDAAQGQTSPANVTANVSQPAPQQFAGSQSLSVSPERDAARLSNIDHPTAAASRHDDMQDAPPSAVRSASRSAPAPAQRPPQLRIEDVELPSEVSTLADADEKAAPAPAPATGSTGMRTRVRARVNANIPDPEPEVTPTKPAGRSKIKVHAAPVAATLAGDDPAATPAAAPVGKRTKPMARTAGEPTVSRRGIVVVIIALLLVGISYVASLLLASSYGGMLPGSPEASSPPFDRPATVAPPLRPSTETGNPLIDIPATPLNAPPALTTTPQRRSDVPANTAPLAASAKEVAPTSQRDIPRSRPETVTDDLSEATIGLPRPALAYNSAPPAASVRMPGIAVDDSATAARAQAARRVVVTTPVVTTINGDPAVTRPAERVAPVPARTSAINGAVTGTSPIETSATANPQTISLGRMPSAPRPQGQPGDTGVTDQNATGDASDNERSAASGPVKMPSALVGPNSLRIAAAQGDPSAAFEVGTRFAEGRGIKQDFAEALVWYQRSASQGFALAQYRLATLYERGLGTQVDYPRASLWYKRAADAGNVKAMHNLAVLSAGRPGVSPNYADAAMWFTAAADHGLSDSQFNLAVLYENGLGVAKDPVTAYKWFALAALGGDKEAARRRDALVSTLDTSALRKATAEVESWNRKASAKVANDARYAGDQWRQNPTADAGRR